MKRPPERWYNPGQSAHFSTQTSVADAHGVQQLTDAPAITLTLRSPDGSEIVDAAPTRDSLGRYHSDQVIPINAKPGIWVARWRSTGSQPAQNTLEEKEFGVNELAF